MLQVAAYCRVSTDKEDQANSFEAQQRYFRDYIERQPDWELQGIYADEGFSGTSTNKRVEFNKMLHAAELGQIDLIVTKEVSRFTRNTVDALQITRELRRRGVGVLFLNDSLDTRTNDGELRLTIMSSFAQDESRRTSERSKWGQMRSMEKGVVFGGSLLGYDVIGGKMTVNPEGAEVVRLIFHKYLQERKGCSTIARELREAGILSSKGNCLWSSATVTKILKNEKYCGDCILQKTVTIDCISKTRKVNQGEAPMYIVENNHPAIISREVFNRAQEELIRRQALRAKSDKTSITATGKHSKYALTEVLQCAECGSRYRRVTWTAHGRKKIVWRCISRLDYGTKHCKDSITVEEAALHGAVVRALRRFHAEDESTYLTLMKATIGEAIGINGGSEEIDLLTRRIDTLNKRMLDLVNETVAAGKDVESSEEEFKGISDQIEQLNRRIAAIQESIHKDGSRQARLEEIQNIIAERNANETQYDDSIVRQMIECIKVHRNGRLTIIFGGGYEIEETL